jgi:uncharacterized repeat protein (TIGR01451 family)
VTPADNVVQTATSCEITQTRSVNIAKCTFKSTAPTSTQVCKITQTGASNSATIAQYISSSTLNTQTGTQTVSVTQSGATVSNIARVTQSVSQSMKGTGEQKQDAYQKATIDQTASGPGYNVSDVNQSEAQKAQGGSPQNQNATPANTADCLPGAPDNPNSCADVIQHSASGTNQSTLNQSIDQDANTAVNSAIQIQGTGSGGLEGHVHQDTVSGSSLNKAKQDKHQKANGPANAQQTQFDPVRCCGTASQFGGSGNVEDINQSSSIGASSPNAEQHSALIGESVTPTGKCTVNQHAAIDSASANNSETLTPCPFLTLTTSCTTGSVDIQAVSRGENCTAFEPYFGVDSTLDKTVRNGDGSFADTTDASSGDIVEFKIDYTNTGPADADNVTVTDVVPDGLAYVVGSCSSSPNPCTYNSDTKTIAWNLGTVPGDETPSLTFRAEVVQEAVGSITNTASASTFEEGAAAAFDSASVSVVVSPPISVLTIGVRNITQGETTFSSVTDAVTDDVLEYEIIYTNTGGSPAHNVTVTAPVPVQTTVSFAGSTSFCPYSGGYDAGFTTLTCVLGPGTDPGTIAPGDLLSLRRVTYTAKVTVPLSFCGTFPATASVVTDETGTTTTAAPANVDANGAPLCIQ